MSAEEKPPVLVARNLTRHFPVHGVRNAGQKVYALEGVNVELVPGQALAVVGESGSGKTTIARLLALQDTPTAGEITLRGDVVEAKRGKARRAYYQQVQMILQNPYESLNPIHRVRYILSRPLISLRGMKPGPEVDAEIEQLLTKVSLLPADEVADKFPYQLSGGQRQRLSIARALAAQPKVLLGDEPISMLDVSIRLDILNLLARLRDEEGLAMLYITHDIASARYFADKIVVMYAGQMIEGGTSEDVTQHPQHPYTELLLAASPDPDRMDVGPATLPVVGTSEPPDLIRPPSGCRFHPRCPHAMAICKEKVPEKTTSADGHWSRCWLHESDNVSKDTDD
ncbi:ABC transporter ATP-binding protein [Luteipulveratus mongoliensis]|uniref:Peptide ABC transporter ATPase n=1 Tax=Luteipulveratus mongoliensis TaxID=571913 RepID=A0A0K1JKJ3_9MICO|nr:ABC transporter ATP-binding protein [Luteipulveratus mongoliensis]AKU17118.1 peptide ABC transporter ATPase [Luteipulveratus mongoliensis]